jgi:ribokinase
VVQLANSEFINRVKHHFDIVVVGGINSDFLGKCKRLPSPGETVQGTEFYSGPGGKGANQAVAAARLGARVALIGRVGDDDRGRALVAGLKREGVFTKFIAEERNQPSGAALVMVDESAEKQILALPGANSRVSARDIQRAKELFANCRVVLMQFEAPLPAATAAARLGKQFGAQVVLDPAPPAARVPENLFRLLDVIRPNANEAEALTGIRVKDRASARKSGRALLNRGVKAAIVSAGSEGDLLVTRDDEAFFPRLRVKSVDATGAGDAFAGALAVGLAEGKPLLEACRLANACAALKTTKLGAQTGLPTRAEVRKFIRGRLAASAGS